MVKLVKSVVFKYKEPHYNCLYDSFGIGPGAAPSIGTNHYVKDLTAISEGDTQFLRTGSQIMLMSLQVKGYVRNTGSAWVAPVRIIVAYLRPEITFVVSGAQPGINTLGNVLQDNTTFQDYTPGSGNSLKDAVFSINRSYFRKVLYDRIISPKSEIDFGPTPDTVVYAEDLPFHFRLPLKQKIVYDKNNDNQVLKGGRLILMMWTPGQPTAGYVPAATVSVGYRAELTFKDI